MPRRKPFSNKKKKEQLQQKREKKRLKNPGIVLCFIVRGFVINTFCTADEKPVADPLCASEKTDSDHDSDSSEGASEEEVTVMKVHHQPTTKSGHDPNRYRYKHVV